MTEVGTSELQNLSEIKPTYTCQSLSRKGLGFRSIDQASFPQNCISQIAFRDLGDVVSLLRFLYWLGTSCLTLRRLLQEIREKRKVLTHKVHSPRQVLNKAFNPSRVKIERVDIVRQMSEHPKII